MLVSVIQGGGMLIVKDERYSIQKGQHFILPYGISNFIIEGVVQLIVSHP